MKSLKLVSVFVLSLFLTISLSCEHYQFEGNPPDDGGGTGTCVEATNNVADATAAYNAVLTNKTFYYKFQFLTLGS